MLTLPSDSHSPSISQSQLTFMIAYFNYLIFSKPHALWIFFFSLPRMLPSLHDSPPHLTHNLTYPSFKCHLLQDDFPGSFRWNPEFSLMLLCDAMYVLRHVWLFTALQIVAHLALLSVEFLGKNTGVSCQFFLQGSSWPRSQTCISCVSCIGRWILYHCSTWESMTNLSLLEF